MHRPFSDFSPGRTNAGLVSSWVEPSAELSGQRDWTGVLGAMSEDGEKFYCQSDEYITGEHARKFILALSSEFDDDLIVVFDGGRISGHRRSPNSRIETISISSNCRRIRQT